MLRTGILLLLFLPVTGYAQQDGLLQLGDPVHRFLERQQTLGRLPDAFMSQQPLSAREAQGYLDSLAAADSGMSSMDRRLLARYRLAEPGPGAGPLHQRFPVLYGNGRDLLSIARDDFSFQAAPLAYLATGRSGRIRPWQNTRGVRAAGRIGRYLFFESRLEETQQRDVRPAPRNWTAPRISFVRLDPDSLVYDYQTATGIIGVRTSHFEVRFGRDRNHWGFGSGSLDLSGYAPAYDQLQIRTTVWRLQYVNLFTAFTDIRDGLPPNRVFPRKYGAFHRLSVHLPGRLQVDLFEGVLFAADSLGGRPSDQRFDIAYMNPIIFYRAVEADRGSPDNMLLGAGISWIALRGLRLYTSLLLDELVVGLIGKRAWENKWAWQLGAHAVDLLPQLSLRAEYTRLRPYLYSHFSQATAHLHFDDLLGHPAGPNAEDFALFAHYRPHERLSAALNLAFTRRGRNSGDINFGADPRVSYIDRPMDEAAFPLLIGVRQEALLLEATIGYELLPDLFAEAALRVERVADALRGVDYYAAPYLELRWGLPVRSVRY